MHSPQHFDRRPGEEMREDQVRIGALRLDCLEGIPPAIRVRQAEHVVEVKEEYRDTFRRLDSVIGFVVTQTLQIDDLALEPGELLSSRTANFLERNLGGDLDRLKQP